MNVTTGGRVYRRRRVVNKVMMGVSTLALAFGLFWLLWILGLLLYEGASALRPSLFTQMTPPPGSDGGLANAIFGSIADGRRWAPSSARPSASWRAPTSPSTASAGGSRLRRASSTTCCSRRLRS